MKFAMIFEGIDRASKVMNKIMAVEKATSGAMAAGNAKAEKASRAAQAAAAGHVGAMTKLQASAQKAYAMVQAGAAKASQAVTALHQKTIALGKAGIGQMGSGAGKVFNGMAVGAGMAVSAFGGAALAAGKLVSVASQFEKFQTILETTEGSSAKAKTAMAWVSNFAAKTPYELDGVMDSFVQLRTRGLDPTNGLMKALGDTSAAMGVPLMQGVEAMADAVTGENERLKAFGITASKTGNKIAYTYTNAAGKQMTASVKATDRMAIQQKLMAIFSEKYGGSMEKLSGTWDGMVSNLADIWSQFQLAIMNAGLFDWMKDKLKFVLDTVNQMADDGTLKVWAEDISTRIMFVLQAAWDFATGTWEVMKTLGVYLKMASDYVGGWGNLAMILAGMAFAPVLISTAAGIVQIVTGLAMLGSALAGLSITGPILAMGGAFAKVGMAMKALGALALANPVVLIAAGIAAAAVAIWYNWEPIKAFFVDLWNTVADFTARAYNKFVKVTGFDPLGAMMRGWNGVSGFLAGVWESLPPLTWENVITALDWLTWVHPLRWLDLIPGFSWAGIISGALDWGKYIVSLDWTEYLPTFSWPDLPSFSWPDIPSLSLPDLPDIAGWIGDFGDRALSAIEGVSSRLGNAWSTVKSAFSFGEASAKLSVTDPATIQAAAAATAGLRADMERVSAIDTTAAMDRLSALQRSATEMLAVVTASVQRAQAFMAGVSFYNQGAALMDTMAAGIRARAQVAVAEIAKVAQMMRDHLPSSPAKIGPLSDIHRLKFGETIAGSIRAEPMVKAMRVAALATMGAAAVNAPAMAGPAIGPAMVGADAARAQVAGVATARAQSNAGNGGASAGQFTLKIEKLEVNATGNGNDVQQQVERAIEKAGRKLYDAMAEEERRRGRTRV